MSDVKEPWLTEGLSTYKVENCAEYQDLSIDDWLELFKSATAERGGTIVHEGDEEDRPDWLNDQLERETGLEPATLSLGS